MATDTIHSLDRPAGNSPTWLTGRNVSMLVALALFWGFILTTDSIEWTMFLRFVTRMAAHAALLLFGLGWWITNRKLTRGERTWGLGVSLVAWLAIAPLCDPTISLFAMLLVGMPWIITLGTLWLLVAGRQSPRVRMAGTAAIALLTFASFTLTRWDGLDGAQHSVLSWRWDPTPEQLFLASTKSADKPLEAAAKPVELVPGDWPEFRGPERDGRVHDARLATDWTAHPPQKVWRQRIGPAWSGITVVGGRLYTQEQRGDNEAVVCYDAASGKQLWAHDDAGRFAEPLSGPGPRATPTFHAGRLYTLGARGTLDCLDAAAGKLIWTHDVARDGSAEVPQWGYSSSPLVVDGQVFEYAGGPAHKALLAYSATDGQVTWSFDAGARGYSSPQLVTLAGTRQLLMASELGVWAVGLDGKKLWLYPNEGMLEPILQPQPLAGDELLVQTANGLARIAVKHEGDKWDVSERWSSRALKPSLNDCVVYQGHVYGFDDGIFCCLDAATGKRAWKRGRYGHGQVLLLVEQGLLLVLSEKGEVVLLTANPKQLEELGRFQAIEGKTWNHPTLAHGRLYVRNDEEMACYEMPTASTSAADKQSDAR